ncbi:hypothetical protein AWE51_17410 [Aquimarina aggregata]|uniref:Adenylate kinase n=1 Tax=Aquimarina aggregata TaxID=1642818 RepID=A0A162WYX4_9FLAO|nr:AAA family ATPase [Aquimarina aggregata]KZS38335.1 hypothetical protein AWE51_17410 [Aquimarina aggregata]
MKIHIFGASGSGTTTLANQLEQRFGWKHLDADDYYWKKTNPPFKEKIPLQERNIKLLNDFKAYDSVIVSGSMVSWGKEWEKAFDVVIFLYVPPKIRMGRLQHRELERYGELLEDNEDIRKNSKAFLKWAQQYDNPIFEGRSLNVHMRWLEKLECQILKIEGDTTVEERIDLVLNKLCSDKNDRI